MIANERENINHDKVIPKERYYLQKEDRKLLIF